MHGIILRLQSCIESFLWISVPLEELFGSSVVVRGSLVEITFLAHHGTLTSLINFIITWDRNFVHCDSSQVFNTLEEFSVLAVEKGDASARLSSSGSPTRSMDVGLCILWWLKLNDKLDIWDMDSS